MSAADHDSLLNEQMVSHVLREVQPIFAIAMSKAIGAFGEVVESQLAELRSQILVLRTRLEGFSLPEEPGIAADFDLFVVSPQTKIEELREELGNVKSSIDEKNENMHRQGAEVTAETWEATSPKERNAVKNIARKYRRRRNKERISTQRDMLLQLRPVSQLPWTSNVSEDVEKEHVSKQSYEKQYWSFTELTLQERVMNLETVFVSACVLHPLSEEFWGPWHSAIPAETLAQQCSAARRIQHAWRHRKHAGFSVGGVGNSHDRSSLGKRGQKA